MVEIDGRILLALQQNGRQSIQDLSVKVGLSPTPVARRVRALEEAGVILGYSALCDEAGWGSA